MTQSAKSRSLFGGDLGWHERDWTDSDDRVRGGSSVSHLDCRQTHAVFYGHLDTKTLGGAGFASQRTAGELDLDLSRFDGVELVVDPHNTDEKTYTLILKDSILPRNPENGREQSTISWEYDFRVQSKTSGNGVHQSSMFIPWQSFKATYRGREKKDAGSPNLRSIKRLSLMMRSFFATQPSGDFNLSVVAIKATQKHLTPAPIATYAWDDHDSISSSKEPRDQSSTHNNRSLWQWMLGKCGKL